MRHLWLLAAATGCTVVLDYGGAQFRCDDGETCPQGSVCQAGLCVRDPSGADAAAASDGPESDGPAEVDASLDPPWWDAAWPHRIRITLATEEAIPIGYQVRIGSVDLDTLPDMTGVSQDSLRVVCWGPGWTEVDRWIDSYEVDETIWARWPIAVPQSTVIDACYLYFGNPSPATAPTDLFEDVDEFTDGVLDSGRWTETGPVGLGGDELQLGVQGSVRTVATWPPGYAVDFAMRIEVWSPEFWGGFQRLSDFVNTEPWMLWIARDTSPDTVFPSIEIDATSEYFSGTPLGFGEEPILYSVERLPDRVSFLRNNDNVDSQAMPAFTDDLQVRLYNGGNETLYFGMFRVRKVVFPGPTVMLGGVETL